MGSLRYSKLIEWFVTAELIAIRDERGWSRSTLGAAIGKHANTIRGWEIGDRLPDKGNIMLICQELGVDPARAAFLAHVTAQVHEGPGVVSDLDKRNLFIVEAAERTYGQVIKWNPVWFSGLLQEEAYHMKVLQDAIDDPAMKVKHWLRKQRRIETFSRRQDAPGGLFLTPASAFADLERLSVDERDRQIGRLREVDGQSNCEVWVVENSHIAPHPFEIFRGGGMPGAGPDFVYVETLDQSRHVVEPEKLALYDQVRSALKSGARRIGRFLDG
jgi:transcriptional regulator with XRE-family HTH domain